MADDVTYAKCSALRAPDVNLRLRRRLQRFPVAQPADADERDRYPERKVERLQRRFVGVAHDGDLDAEPDDQGLAGRAGEERGQAMAPPGQDRSGQRSD